MAGLAPKALAAHLPSSHTWYPELRFRARTRRWWTVNHCPYLAPATECMRGSEWTTSHKREPEFTFRSSLSHGVHSSSRSSKKRKTRMVTSSSPGKQLSSRLGRPPPTGSSATAPALSTTTSSSCSSNTGLRGSSSCSGAAPRVSGSQSVRKPTSDSDARVEQVAPPSKLVCRQRSSASLGGSRPRRAAQLGAASSLSEPCRQLSPSAAPCTASSPAPCRQLSPSAVPCAAPGRLVRQERARLGGKKGFSPVAVP
mmetsp:Transcript_110883/g.324387  ORF Transcript_110883/g.324387 Transcript_110883/m.324387 type:complete len:255 (-) Transcript_110883:161-925(-)